MSIQLKPLYSIKTNEMYCYDTGKFDPINFPNLRILLKFPSILYDIVSKQTVLTLPEHLHSNEYPKFPTNNMRDSDKHNVGYYEDKDFAKLNESWYYNNKNQTFTMIKIDKETNMAIFYNMKMTCNINGIYVLNETGNRYYKPNASLYHQKLYNIPYTDLLMIYSITDYDNKGCSMFDFFGGKSKIPSQHKYDVTILNCNTLEIVKQFDNAFNPLFLATFYPTENASKNIMIIRQNKDIILYNFKTNEIITKIISKHKTKHVEYELDDQLNDENILFIYDQETSTCYELTDTTHNYDIVQ